MARLGLTPTEEPAECCNGDDAAQAQLLKACIEHNIPVQQFASEANTLERTFLQVTAGLN